MKSIADQWRSDSSLFKVLDSGSKTFTVVGVGRGHNRAAYLVGHFDDLEGARAAAKLHAAENPKRAKFVDVYERTEEFFGGKFIGGHDTDNPGKWIEAAD